MIPLHPNLDDTHHSCPYCQIRLEVKGWIIPGMRNLADLHCAQCGRKFYGDLASGQALFTPLLLEKETGSVHDPYNVVWFANWLQESYANRTSTSLELTIREYRPLRGQAVFLNCLDTLYGHSLLKLLNAQYYLDHRPDLDLIVMIPRFLEWMVPDGAAQVWIVDLPLRRGTEWNDWLAAELKRRISELQACWLSVAFSHPHPKDYDIERFTGVQPFPIAEWETRLQHPTITFIWREDRVWDSSGIYGDRRLFPRIKRRAKYRLFPSARPLARQTQRVLALAAALRHKLPNLNFAVAGLGRPGGMPDWITDLRRSDIDEVTEHLWCERYASSHIVVGVHGSNMLLPSAHAGTAIELVPPERWGNIPQSTLFRRSDSRLIIYRYRYYPLNTTVYDLADSIVQLLAAHGFMTLLMPMAVCDHAVVSNSKTFLPSLRAFGGSPAQTSHESR